MSSWDKRYSDRMQLLVDILPVLAKETRFALKGGTAINLFEHNLPRLSVDIDLTWLPVQDYETGMVEIAAALLQHRFSVLPISTLENWRRPCLANIPGISSTLA